MIEVIVCHQDYFEYVRTPSPISRIDDFVPIVKQCGLQVDDHCQIHCPKEASVLEETDPDTEMTHDGVEVTWTLTCYYCGRTWQDEPKYYKEEK